MIAPDVTGTVLESDAPEATRSYAEALLNAASKEGQAEEALDELDAILGDVLAANPRFAALLFQVGGPVADRDRILTATFEGRALPVVVRSLRVLNRHGRLNLLGAIARTARALWDRRENRRPVSVRSAVPLDDDQQARLREKLSALLGGATPVLTVTHDPSLIGGLVVQIGDDVYDASVRRRLQLLRQQLVVSRTREIQSRRDQLIFDEPETAPGP